MNDPIEQGAEAYREGLPLGANLYADGTMAAVEWEGGWMEAEEAEEAEADG